MYSQTGGSGGMVHSSLAPPPHAGYQAGHTHALGWPSIILSAFVLALARTAHPY